MAELDTVSISILLGAALVFAGILSSLVAMRFGAPLLLVFLGIGMLAGESGPGGIRFDDVRSTYVVGSVGLALILFDGGLRTRVATFRRVLAPALVLATVGVVLTAAVTAPFAKFALGLDWTQSLLVGSVVASTDAAAVFFLIHAQGLRLRPRVAAALEVESGTNDPFAIFLTIALIEILVTGHQSWATIFSELAVKGIGGGIVGVAAGHAIVFGLNRLGLPQGLHAVFVATGALLVFGLGEAVHASGFLAVYLAGLVVGNRPTRAHSTIVAFLDAVTWLAQIVMFTLLGLLVWPNRLVSHALPALVVAFGLMLVARPLAVFLCLTPFRFPRREKLFVSWVGLRGAVGIFLASIPLLVKLPNAQIYFDVGFVVVLASLVVQGWSIALAAHKLHIALPPVDPGLKRVELDLPGQLAQELVGYTLGPTNPYLRRRLIPSWAKLMMVVRQRNVLTAEEAEPVREGDHVYLLAPPEKATALDRFFIDMPAPTTPDPQLLGDFYVAGDASMEAIAEIYGQPLADEDKALTVTTYFARRIGGRARKGDIVTLGAISLVATDAPAGTVTRAGLRLAEPPARPVQRAPRGLRLLSRLRAFWKGLRRRQRPPQ
jgi:cell volume regulation protein A